jgi:hypothetical protein
VKNKFIPYSWYVQISLLGLLVLIVNPSFGTPQALSDKELDLITAGGEPTVVTAGNNSVVTFSPATDIALDIQPNSQASLRALALNNVAGENQVVNGMNISGSNLSGDQRNSINQSWGSINDTTAVVLPTVTAGVSATCTGLICNQTGSVAVVPGTIAVLSNTADQTINAGAASAIFYIAATNVAMTIESNAQAGLVALVVNNVAGLNQVGNAINIKGGGLSASDSGLSISAGAGQGGGQSNVINQSRGTPSNFSR